jgi:hypothetical protein
MSTLIAGRPARAPKSLNNQDRNWRATVDESGHYSFAVAL